MSSSTAPWQRIGDLAVQVSDIDASRRSCTPRPQRHLVSLSDTEESRWLAAYALGLAYSTMPDSEVVRLLAGAATSRRDLLAAQAQLQGWTVVDPAPQPRALGLLAAASQRDDSFAQPIPAE